MSDIVNCSNIGSLHRYESQLGADQESTLCNQPIMVSTTWWTFYNKSLNSSKWLMRTNYSHSIFSKHCKTLLFSIFILNNNIIFTQKIHILPAFVTHDKTTEKTSPTRMYQSIEHNLLCDLQKTLCPVSWHYGAPSTIPGRRTNSLWHAQYSGRISPFLPSSSCDKHQSKVMLKKKGK